MNQYDTIVRRGKSVIQHGRFNNRVYVMRLDPADIPGIIRFADALALREGYSKIFVKVPESSVDLFTASGYIREAMVPCFYRGTEPAIFMAKYFEASRKEVSDPAIVSQVLEGATSHAITGSFQPLPPGFSLAVAGEDDAPGIAALYRLVFETYPFPIFDPAFLRESMQGDVRYYIVRNTHTLAAVASCEIDTRNRNIEVTDFATNPIFRGRGFASTLLHTMETEMKKEGGVLAYTIARATFPPINMVFSAAGYRFGGLLPNNTNICGAMESMNVWYKRL
jgi:putative beta-lysine N-acetyltransferase